MNDIQWYQHLWLSLASNKRYDAVREESDLILFNERVTNEGLSFLTQGLPTIGKALDRYHATNTWTSPIGFDTKAYVYPYSDNANFHYMEVIYIPVFMGRAIQKALTGDSTAVDYIRQMSYIFYKLEVPYDEGVESQFLDQFISTDHELGFLSFDSASADEYQLKLIELMRKTIGRILCNEDPLDIVPSHGSGATACRTPNYEKYHKLRYYQKLDDVFHYSDYFFFSPTHLVDEMDKLESSPHMDPTARVCLVPKDSRGPRIISCEPAELMYIQQGLMRKLYDCLENHPITRGQLNFTDQTINRDLALEGSITNALSTLDLAEASDRVSLQLIEEVFPPRWVVALRASRSDYTTLPDGRMVKLNKFAPMGSSCCFPVEALVFWTCARAAIRLEYGFDIRTISVYGDDIIVPSNFAEVAIRGLEAIGLKVNRDKCFVDGPFRESCGGEYYKGVDVTPVKLRKPFNTSLMNLDTTADFVNNLITKFGYDSISRLISTIEMSQRYVFPRTPLALPGTICVPTSASNDVFFPRRWNKDLQRFEHRILRLACKVKQRHDPNWGELLRKQLTKSISNHDSDRYVNRLTIADRRLLPGQYSDPHSVCSKWEWTWLG